MCPVRSVVLTMFSFSPSTILLELGGATPSLRLVQWNAELNYWARLGPEWGCSQDLISHLSSPWVDLVGLRVDVWVNFCPGLLIW